MPSPSLATRLSLIVGGVLIAIGGPMHPGGTMAEMLADPVWFTAHALVTAGFCGLLAGLELLRRQGAVPASVARWLLLAVIATTAQTIDMAVHTMAYTRALGSSWISWIGVLGCLGHGIAGPGTVLFDLPWARALFPTIVLVALWAILAGVWPAAARATEFTETV